MSPRQREILATVAVAYAASVVVLFVTRVGLGWDDSGQIFASALAGLVVLLPAAILDRRRRGRWAGADRTTGQALVGAAVFLVVFALNEALRFRMPDDRAIVTVGLLFPAFYVAQIAIDWERLGRADASDE